MLMDINMKEIGRMINKMVRVRNGGQMEVIMRDNIN